jgi:hypothetical protein
VGGERRTVTGVHWVLFEREILAGSKRPAIELVMFGEEKVRERFGNGSLLNGGRRWAEPLGWEILKVLGQNFSEMKGYWMNIRFSTNFL